MKKARPALPPDALIATGRVGRIRLIEKPPPRRRRPSRIVAKASHAAPLPAKRT